MQHQYFEGIDEPLTEAEDLALVEHEARTVAAYDDADACIVSSAEAIAIQEDEDFIFREYRLRRDRKADLKAFREARRNEFFGPANPAYDLQSGKRRANLAAKKLQYDSGKENRNTPAGRRAYATVFLEKQAKDEVAALESRRLNYGYNGDEEKCDFHKTTIKELFTELRAYVQADLDSLDNQLINSDELTGDNAETKIANVATLDALAITISSAAAIEVPEIPAAAPIDQAIIAARIATLKERLSFGVEPEDVVKWITRSLLKPDSAEPLSHHKLRIFAIATALKLYKVVNLPIKELSPLIGKAWGITYGKRINGKGKVWDELFEPFRDDVLKMKTKAK